MDQYSIMIGVGKACDEAVKRFEVNDIVVARGSIVIFCITSIRDDMLECLNLFTKETVELALSDVGDFNKAKEYARSHDCAEDI